MPPQAMMPMQPQAMMPMQPQAMMPMQPQPAAPQPQMQGINLQQAEEFCRLVNELKAALKRQQDLQQR